ncbi:hypothetical protein AMATHDRAFT_72164 [Amanita thiersii Skay4041]|uniref:Methionine aminopeptidase n=1 Tax=Amanita thiersii Skay4041 TaxID=703135 RepID=A0A2A9N5W2_9AGAR|nr:hypothetical protein AMATHDRAFT_72164 [Amanita thiersii Skay4041]
MAFLHQSLKRSVQRSRIPVNTALKFCTSNTVPRQCYPHNSSLVPSSAGARRLYHDMSVNTSTRTSDSSSVERTSENDSTEAYSEIYDIVPDFGIYSVILPPEPIVFGVEHIKPLRSVPSHIAHPAYAAQVLGGSVGGGTASERTNATATGGLTSLLPRPKIALGTLAETRIRAAANLAKRTREYGGSLVKPGVTTNEIDKAVHEFVVTHGAYPSPLGYKGFPKSCCTSVNNIIAHGIPDDRPLEDGDIVNIDVTVYLDGYHGDTSQTFPVGNVDALGWSLIAATNLALKEGISACGLNQPYKGIGHAIHHLLRRLNRSCAIDHSQEVDEARSFCVSPQFTGHGIGTEFHTPPWIIHDLNEEPGTMQLGDCFTIEPCIIQGTKPTCWTFPDGWTASTMDCARSAQVEHMVLITEKGVEVLTE